MARPTKSTVEWFRQREDGKKGCHTCGAIATRWIDFSHNGQPRFVSTAYCDEHGDDELKDPNVTERRIRNQA